MAAAFDNDDGYDEILIVEHHEPCYEDDEANHHSRSRAIAAFIEKEVEEALRKTAELYLRQEANRHGPGEEEERQPPQAPDAAGGADHQQHQDKDEEVAVSSRQARQRHERGSSFERARLRRYVYFLQQGSMVKKKMDGEKDYRDRYIFVSEDLQWFCWSKSSTQRHLAKAVLLLGLQIKKGPPAVRHRRQASSEGFSTSTFSIMLANKHGSATAIDLRCESEALCDAWSVQLGALLTLCHFPEDGPREAPPTYDTPQQQPGSSSTATTCEDGPRPFAVALAEELVHGSIVRYYSARNFGSRSSKKKTSQELASFRDHAMSHPIMPDLPDALAARAVEAFALVMQFMGDDDKDSRGGEGEGGGGAGGQGVSGGAEASAGGGTSGSSSRKLGLLRRLVAMGESTPGLRDELYLQVVKQTTDNPRESSRLRGWEVLAAYVQAFLPQDNAALPACLLLHADRVRRQRADAIGALAFHVHAILCEGCEGTWRPGPPVTVALLSEIERRVVPASIFGCTLEEVLRKETVLRCWTTTPANGRGRVSLPASGVLLERRVVPEVLQCLVGRFHELDGYGVEGVFRRAADTDLVAMLRRGDLAEGSYVAYGTEAVATDDVLVVADLIKSWLRSLTEPLIPFRFYDRAIEAGSKAAADLGLARALWRDLPPANREALRYLLRFLNRCAEQAARSQMTKLNLSLVFSPNLLQNPGADPHVMMANTDLERRVVAQLMEVVGAEEEVVEG